MPVALSIGGVEDEDDDEGEDIAISSYEALLPTFKFWLIEDASADRCRPCPTRLLT